MNSVVVRWADRPAVDAAVRTWAERLRRSHPEVRRVIWFGSWVHGTPGPGSDVDLCVLLSRSDKPFRDRIPDYLPGAFPVGVDLFPYTTSEFERLRTTSPSWHAEISRGREL